MELKEILNIKKEDMRNFNLYLASLNKNLGMLLAGSVIAILGIYGLFTGGKEELLINIITIVLGVAGLLFPLLFNKFIFTAKINKMEFEDLEPVEVVVSEEGMLYRFVSEKDSQEFLPYKWTEMLRAVEKDKYLYIHLSDRRSVIIITLEDLQNPEFLEFIKRKLIPLKRYLARKKG